MQKHHYIRQVGAIRLEIHGDIVALRKELSHSFPLIGLMERAVLGFLVISAAGFVDFGAIVRTQCVWMVAKVRGTIRNHP